MLGSAWHFSKQSADRIFNAAVPSLLFGGAILASWIFPPWKYRGDLEWGFILSAQEGYVDFTRLILIDLILGVLGALAAWIALPRCTLRPLVVRFVSWGIFGLILLVPLSASAAGIIGAGKLFSHILLMQKLDEENAVRKVREDMLRIDPETLKRISVSDCSAHVFSGAYATSAKTVDVVHGTVVNNTARAVQMVYLKASFYSPSGSLIQDRTFGPLPAGAAVLESGEKYSFSMRFWIQDLNPQFKWSLNVVEAQYAESARPKTVSQGPEFDLDQFLPK